MKVVVLGGSAFSTPALFASLAHVPEPPAVQLRLVARDGRALEAIRRAAEIMSAGSPLRLETKAVESTPSADDLAGADIVLIQVRVGGFAGRSWDESFPPTCGIPGDEGLGPGGLSAALRSWPTIERLLEVVQRAAPRSLVLMLSSPVGLFVRAALTRFPALSVAGICELPWTTLRGVCEVAGCPPEKCRFGYLGLSHLGWFHRIADDGRDLVEAYARTRVESPVFPSADLIRRVGAIPTSYLRLHYDRESVLAEQRRRPRPRGGELEELRREALRVYATAPPEGIAAALARRPAPWYEHAVVPFLLGHCGRAVRTPVFLTVRQSGAVPGFPDDEVLEIPHCLEGGRWRPRASVGEGPIQVRGLLTRFVVFERSATKALLDPEAGRVEEALAEHPWVPDRRTASVLAGKIADYSGPGAARGVARG